MRKLVEPIGNVPPTRDIHYFNYLHAVLPEICTYFVYHQQPRMSCGIFAEGSEASLLAGLPDKLISSDS
jgi:hypothetical protein